MPTRNLHRLRAKSHALRFDDAPLRPDGHKSGGRPFGIDARNLPPCRDCRRPLQLVAQIDLRDHRLGLVFGGLKHLFVLHAFDSTAVGPLVYRVPPRGRAIRVVRQAAGECIDAPATVLPEVPLTLVPRDAPVALDEAAHQVGGDPFWLDGPADVACPICGRGMGFLAQFDREERCGWRFGDAGMLYALGCSPCRTLATLVQEP